MDHSPDHSHTDMNAQIQALIEGELSPKPFAEVQKRIARDPAFRARYLRAVKTDFLLDEFFGVTRATRQNLTEAHFGKTTAHGRSHIMRVAALAALLVLGIFVTRLFLPDSLSPGSGLDSPLLHPGEPLPKVEFAASSIYESEAPLARGDDRIRAGDRVAMREGFVSITLKSGVEAVIESPSQFSISGDNQMNLESGAAWFRVPETARGFSVQLPKMDVVDLGTEFTVVAHEGMNRVQVNAGVVEVRGEFAGLEPHRLRAGQTLEVTGLGDVSISSGGLFLRPLGMPDEETLFLESLIEVPNKSFARRQPLAGKWEIEEGRPRVQAGRFLGKSDSGRTAVFGHFTRPVKADENAIVILSFRSVPPRELFHSEGYAGISLFDGEAECFFFGDRSKDSYSWSLLDYGPDYRQGRQSKGPHTLDIQGSAESFTIRYRQRTGDIEVYRGWGLQGVPVLRTRITPNLPFDRVRVVSGKGGDFSFDRLLVSVARDSRKD